MREHFWLVGLFWPRTGSTVCKLWELPLPLPLWFELLSGCFSRLLPHDALFTFSMGHGLATAFFFAPSGLDGSRVHRYCNQCGFLVLDCWAREMGIKGFFIYGSMNGIWDIFTVFSYGFTM